jgi:hypothetical protein
MEMRTFVMNGAQHFGIWIEMPLLDFLSECPSLLANFVFAFVVKNNNGKPQCCM